MFNPDQARVILDTLARKARIDNDVVMEYTLACLSEACFGREEQDGLDSVERNLLDAGMLINAVKHLRGRYAGTTALAATLAGARQVVEAYQAKHPRQAE
jgi:hypothetical protein